MKRALTIILIVLGTSALAPAQEAAIDVKGAWNATIESPQGAFPLSLSFTKVEGDKLTGTLSSPQGDLPISGTITGTKITFTATFSGNGMEFTLTFTGTVAKDAMSGEADFGGRGSGAWSAKRAG